MVLACVVQWTGTGRTTGYPGAAAVAPVRWVSSVLGVIPAELLCCSEEPGKTPVLVAPKGPGAYGLGVGGLGQCGRGALTIMSCCTMYRYSKAREAFCLPNNCGPIKAVGFACRDETRVKRRAGELGGPEH